MPLSCLTSALSPVCAAARCFRAGLRCLLHHLGSGQVQRDPHAKRTCGKGHGRRRQRGEDVAPAGRRERGKNRGDCPSRKQGARSKEQSRSLGLSSESHNNRPQIGKKTNKHLDRRALSRMWMVFFFYNSLSRRSANSANSGIMCREDKGDHSGTNLNLNLKPYFLPRAFMSHNQEVRALMRPPIWSALPLLGSGTNTRMRVPAVMPRTGDT